MSEIASQNTLQVQNYLRSGKTLENLQEELGIKSTLHPTLPLVNVNYNQIESPKTHPIVRECRALTLDTRDWSVVSKSMNRFFNWGEVADEMDLFDFSNFIVQTKEDGSLVKLFYFDGRWHTSTRGSFALDSMQGCMITWEEGIQKALGVRSFVELESQLDPSISYVCEFCSPWNKVVRSYKEPVVYLLTAFQGTNELKPHEVDALVKSTRLVRPQRFEFKNIQEIQNYIQQQGTDDPSYEGIVMCDQNFQRWKVKSSTYLALHALKGEGNNIFMPKYLVPFVMTGEESELLLYYPEVTDAFNVVKCKVLQEYARLLETWIEYKDVEGQKEFAQKIIGKTPFTNILFNLRKFHGQDQSLKDLKKMWRESEDKIINLF